MIVALEHAVSPLFAFAVELRKIPAFARRDFLIAWSYRMAFFTDLAALASATVMFYFIGKLVDPKGLPTYAGTQVTYLEFAAVGLALGVFIQFGLERVAAAMRNEQLMGTLESVLATPTAPSTLQVGSVAFDLLYVPVRTIGFLAVVALVFGLHFDPAGLLPAALVLLLFIPFVWGLGVFSAAAMLTFRRGSGLVGLGTMALALISGVYFPIALLPDWLSGFASSNPIALAIEGMRESVLGGAGVGDISRELLLLVPMSALSLAGGLAAFRLALKRERGTGALGMY